MDLRDSCAATDKFCGVTSAATGVPEKQVTRGCYATNTNANVKYCATNTCNSQIVSMVCYTCFNGNPACVYSQGSENVEECEAGNSACYTRIMADGYSVARGCAPTRQTHPEPGYAFCDAQALCNDESTILTSCNMRQVNARLEPRVQFPKAYYTASEPRSNWKFQTCRDGQAEPVCHLEASARGISWGCSATDEGFQTRALRYGDLMDTVATCDGDYCNEIP